VLFVTNSEIDISHRYVKSNCQISKHIPPQKSLFTTIRRYCVLFNYLLPSLCIYCYI